MATGLFGAGAAVKFGRGDSAVSAWTGQATNSVLNQAKPMAGKNDLRITRVDPYIVRFVKDAKGQLTGNFCLLCRVETADGIVGWGEGTNFPKVATIATEIEMNRSTVVGQSAWDIEKIWYDISRSRAAMHGSAVQSAISAIDIALWDIIGQKLGVPVYRLIGGKVNESLRYYRSGGLGNVRTPDAYRDATRKMVAEGSIAVKIDPFQREEGETTATSLNREVTLKEMADAVGLVRGIREGGPMFEIGLDVHAKFNTGGAIRVAKALEPYNVMFLEEPILSEEASAMREVQAATSTPIAAGERLKSRFQMYRVHREGRDSPVPAGRGADRRHYGIPQGGLARRNAFRAVPAPQPERRGVPGRASAPGDRVDQLQHPRAGPAQSQRSAGRDASARAVRRVAAEPVAFLRAGPPGSRDHR